MGFSTALSDVQDPTGVSFVVPNVDGTRPPLVLRLGSGLTATYAKDGATGVVTVAMGTGSDLSGASLTLGTAPQQMADSVVTGTSTSTAAGSTPIVKTFAIAGPGSTTVAVVAKARIDLLSTVSIFADIAAVIGAVRPASGAPDSAVANTDTIRRLAAVAPFGPGSTTVAVVGNSIVLTFDLGTIPAWVNTTAYTAGPAGTARHVVTNDTGKIYACITPGTSAGSGGPTGTGANITDGTAHWAYVGTSLTVQWTIFLDVRTG